MQLWQDGLLAMLAAVGLASLIWAAVRAVLFPLSPVRRETVALIPAQGDGEYLEQQVQTLQLLRQEQNIFGLILLVDCGLSSEGKKISQLLARQNRFVAVCDSADIGRYLRSCI